MAAVEWEPKYALSYAPFYTTRFEDFVASAADAGFEAVELIPDQAPNLYSEFDAARLAMLRSLVRHSGIELSMHNVFYDINLVSMVPAVRQAALSITKAVLTLCRDVGASGLTVHPGYMFPGWRAEAQRAAFRGAAADGLGRLANLAAEFAVPVYLENGAYHLCTATGRARRPLHVGITPEESVDMLNLMGPDALICLDIGKAKSTGRPLEAFIGALGDRVGQVQVSVDAETEATVAVLRSLYARGFDGLVVLEGGRARTAAEFRDGADRLTAALSELR